MHVISVGIVGGTGYTGVELLRLLLRHPKAQVRVLTSRTEAGKRVADMFPSLRGHTDLIFRFELDALNSVMLFFCNATWCCNATCERFDCS
jgi:N-acetyl-gamma-glutamyl-phosphate reductase